MLKRLQSAGLSVNFAKCIFGSASMEFLGMVIDSTGIHPAPSKLEAIACMLRPRTVEELRTFLGMTGYLRQFVRGYSLICAPLTDILRNKDFASKRARKCPIPWGHDEQFAFDSETSWPPPVFLLSQTQATPSRYTLMRVRLAREPS